MDSEALRLENRHRLCNWIVGKKRTFNGEVYATKKERNRAYQNSLMNKNSIRSTHGRKEAGSSAP